MKVKKKLICPYVSNISKLEVLIEKAMTILRKSDTNSIWLTYIDMVDILNDNLMAERSSNWDLYIISLKKMLPFLAGAGRSNYTKSLFWFIQEMDDLNQSFFVVRRSDTFWSGISPDLCIEQSLMASFKGSSGLTRGRS